MKILLIFLLILSQKFLAIFSSDAISPNQLLQDNGQTLVSAGETFELGFFSPPNSNKSYVGIWFKSVPDFTVVWVANRDNPLAGSSPSGHALKLTDTGNILIISNNSVFQVWSSNSSAKNPTLQLLDSGNLVVRDSSANHVWESFDYPGDSLLAGMKIGWNVKTRKQWRLSSWNSTDDPSTGKYTYEIDPVFPQLVQIKGSEIQFRSGPWDGVQFSGDFPLTGNQMFYPVFVFNETYVYYTFESSDRSTITRFWMTPFGTIQQLRWSRDSSRWVTIFEVQKDDCDTFVRCGPNGFCSAISSHTCSCPEGFAPVAPDAWHGFDYMAGCALRTRLNCTTSIGFKEFSSLKLPYSSNVTVNPAIKKKEDCEQICRRNCSCTAYSIVGVNGCVMWFGQLLDVRIYDGTRGGSLFIKMASSELGTDDDGKRTALIVSVSVVSGVLLILFSMGLYVNRKKNARSHVNQEETTKHPNEEEKEENDDDDAILLEEDIELPSFGLHAISNATNCFSFTNKIGEGGFGLVYKGILPTGQEIAVKRLSKDSGQGLKEFKNEVILISKLQHRNLVRLLGCCIHKEDRMLIYEYMSNKSLDLYLFNQSRGTSLDWPKRFGIIVGIARGILYLHRDSRLRIIHRDLKASNVLLDDEMNPKISDFGLARIFGGDQNEVNTKRVVGTYGYMSPEYAIDGHFSVKSDVFSFGVMVLEIVSGKKNRGFEHQDHDLNLLGHAWKLWNDGRPMELVDALMEDVPVSEVMKCIQAGLLCVQKRPDERPLMSSVLYMLDSTDQASLPQPKQPGFYVERAFTETDSSSSLNNNQNVSTEMSITNFHGR